MSEDDSEPAQSAPVPDQSERRLTIASWAFVMCAFAITAGHVLAWATDVPLWDDFDGFLDFLVRIEKADSFPEHLTIANEFHNEHRTLTTRLVTWAVHAWTGAQMNFRALGIVSASLLLPIATLFVLTFRARDERRMAMVVAAALLFSLQLHEVLFWGGACEHISAVLLAMAGLVALRWRAPAGLFFGTGLGVLSALTLAHGFVVFPAGALVLALERRWRDASFLLCAGVFVGLFWMYGYHGNPEHGSLDASIAQATEILWFWLGMLGTPLAFGQRAIAPWLGIVVLAGAGVALLAAGWRNYLFHLSVMLYAAGAALLISIGRAPMDPGIFMGSRYRLLACLIIATTGVLANVFVKRIRPRIPSEWIIVALAIAYTAEKTDAHWKRGREHHERLKAAAAYYAEHRTLHGSPVELYYNVPKADRILSDSRKRRIYDLRAVGEDMIEATD